MRIPGVDGEMSEETTTWNQDDLHLGEKFDDLVFNSTGGVFPFEAQGSYMGEQFYFRYRWSEASLSYGVEKENVYFYPKYKARAFHEKSPDGFLTQQEFEDLFTSLLYDIIRQKG